ncbi:hypothetical protein [Rhizobium tumorigenes]|uniref:hypothetical protein n=1 Tax=Rhizobium tumorigenes TaxID=2041385 RepID=UPI00241DA4F5|nr:hypothetical protein [Rhizobium tumorigenes]WFS03280.1 hypothetical protein PR016_21785 [Rhizobium tumorigenes]
MRLLVSLVAVLGAALIAGCIFVIASLFTPVHYWDQWEMAKYVSQGGHLSLAYLLSPHNEHIIATSKLLFYADLWLFGYANRSLVAAIVIIHLSIAYAFASILVGRGKSLEKFLWFCIFGAMMLSLAQWENLTIGFQTQFGLTGLSAVLSCVFATRFVTGVGSTTINFAALTMFTVFTVFSMGNGVALAASFAAVTVLVRSPRLANVLAMFFVYGLCLAIFVIERSGTGASTHVDLSALVSLVRFFMAVLGGTVTRDFGTATFIGILILASFVGIFAITGLIPRLQGKVIDRQTIVFLAIAMFTMGSAAAVTVGRFSLGPGAALASRYATPNILLYCSLLAAMCRYFMVRYSAVGSSMRTSATFGFAGLIMACGLVFRPAAIHQLMDRSETLTSASYFVLSGIRADSVLADLYPEPNAIRAPLEYLRANQLNIFSPRFGLNTLNRKIVENVAGLPACPTMDVDPPARLEDTSWKVSGTVGRNEAGDSPRWMMTTDMAGHVLGFAPPSKREVQERHAFSVPAHFDGTVLDRRIYLLAQWDENEFCRLTQVITLPARNLVKTLPGETRATDYEEKDSLTGGADHIPDAVGEVGKVFGTVKSTWQRDDAATGSITFILPNTGGTCSEAYVRVMRGPTSKGITVETGQEGGATETVTLGSISPHQWWWLNVRDVGACASGGRRFVRLVDKGSEWGAWGAITAPVVFVPTSNN